MRKGWLMIAHDVDLLHFSPLGQRAAVRRIP